MSDDKKVIHVKDLVIKADNVHIQPSQPSRPHPRRDPFFGRWDMGRHEESTDKESVDKESAHDKESSSEEKRDRKPFSWF
ncbi:hypothetical protein [Lentibacillus sp. CBA3610]|uniref:hypothetical protein n=1 Tax=Lentibacillus sp. CBA3610 TaxID=2518176 RepID=UPI001595CD53|nr:hypothetical protein [Lentibacillus sp. CBA3610]QKY68626.1 hypothetical protein Len3610_02405 [Lentibacillus sp. CBA3610]